MNKICFNDACCKLECEYYIEWDHEEEIWDHNKGYVSTIPCASCTKIGQSYNVEEYPADCPHKEILTKFEDQKKKDHIWAKLNA